MNHASLNLANALGAWLGGLVIAAGLRLPRAGPGRARRCRCSASACCFWSLADRRARRLGRPARRRAPASVQPAAHPGRRAARCRCGSSRGLHHRGARRVLPTRRRPAHPLHAERRRRRGRRRPPRPGSPHHARGPRGGPSSRARPRRPASGLEQADRGEHDVGPPGVDDRPASTPRPIGQQPGDGRGRPARPPRRTARAGAAATAGCRRRSTPRRSRAYVGRRPGPQAAAPSASSTGRSSHVVRGSRGSSRRAACRPRRRAARRAATASERSVPSTHEAEAPGQPARGPVADVGPPDRRWEAALGEAPVQQQPQARSTAPVPADLGVGAEGDLGPAAALVAQRDACRRSGRRPRARSPTPCRRASPAGITSVT